MRVSVPVRMGVCVRVCVFGCACMRMRMPMVVTMRMRTGMPAFVSVFVRVLMRVIASGLMAARALAISHDSIPQYMNKYSYELYFLAAPRATG